MTQVNLNFDGPFTFNDLVNQKEAFNPGIYIWGFKYPDPGRFIPYYVGKSLTNIVGRIAQHKKDLLKVNSTYVRLSDDLMKTFYKLSNLERLIRPDKTSVNEPDWFKKFPFNGIEYINTRWFIKYKAPIGQFENQDRNPSEAKDYPIDLLQQRPNDFLTRNINDLLICYAVYPVPKDENGIVISQNGLYEHIESITKCSLKGRTLGKKEKPVNSNEFEWSNDKYKVIINPHNFEAIFKNKDQKVITDDSDYPGY